jgi:uncharacterized protein (DUF488 family)
MPGRTVPPATIYSIGHSNHPIGRFLELLQGAGIEAVLDVRSIPYSRRFPQFGRPRLEAALRGAGIGYVFLGESLGGKPAGGAADYDQIAATSAFEQGLAQVAHEGATRRAALMCAEKAPLDCHRTVLVARHLAARGNPVAHILADGGILPHGAVEDELLRRYAPADDLLTAHHDRRARLEIAYRARGRQMTGSR